MDSHFDIRRDAVGWTVFDRWTGETVVLSNASQCGLTWLEADELVARLSRRSDGGDRRILQ